MAHVHLCYGSQNDETRPPNCRASIKSPATSRCIHSTYSRPLPFRLHPHDRYTHAPDARRCDLAPPDLLSRPERRITPPHSPRLDQISRDLALYQSRRLATHHFHQHLQHPSDLRLRPLHARPRCPQMRPRVARSTFMTRTTNPDPPTAASRSNLPRPRAVLIRLTHITLIHPDITSNRWGRWCRW